MPITSQITCVGLLLTFSSLNTSVSPQASSNLDSSHPSIEYRLSRLTEAMRQREANGFKENIDNNQLARGWADGNRRDWVNTNRGGFANRHGGGGFVNRNWGDGGRFYNHSGDGGFANRGGGGGFFNR